LPNDDLIEKIDKELSKAKAGVKQVVPVIASKKDGLKIIALKN